MDVMVRAYRDRARFDRLAEELRDRAWLDHLDDPMTGFLRWRRYGNHHPGYFRTELSYARRLSGLETVEAQTSGAAR